MLADYISLVKHVYERKREAKDLSLNLIDPSSGQIRDECIALIRAERYQKKDINALNAFFGHCSDKEAFLRAINNFDIDKFKPLVNFLNGETKEPKLKIVELLAWLIDFKDRPFEYNKKYSIPSKSQTDIQLASHQEKQENPPVEVPEVIQVKEEEISVLSSPGSIKPSIFASWRIRSILFIIVLAIILSVIYLYRWKKPVGVILPGDGLCMYWTGDHYQQIPCNQKPDNTSIVIALDSEKLVNFKKITESDTLTDASLGKVWYSKINGNIEFFTSGGFHPINSQIKLKPLTSYMLRIYVHPIQAIEQASK